MKSVGIEHLAITDATAASRSARGLAIPADWPHVSLSRRVAVRGRHWHLQRTGHGPGLLLVHGTGASTHSWRSLIPVLSRRFDVLALDLPGHGFTGRHDDEPLTLTNMASAVGELLSEIRFRPDCAVGHSAGAAILLQMSVTGVLPASTIIGLNPALLPFGGAWQPLLNPFARVCANSRLLPRLIASRARDPEAVRRMIASTGSHLDRAGLDLYRRLMSREAHVAAVLSMMGNWDLEPLCRALPEVPASVTLISGARDLAIRDTHMRSIAAIWPCVDIAGPVEAGHLAHEECPEEIAALIENIIDGRRVS